jgi:anti-sigma factor ChrR (cupin superfamily)
MSMITTESALVYKDILQAGTDYQSYPWQPFQQGVDIYRLYGDGTGAGAALLRYQAGASVPQHRHTGFEHILVLEGTQSDRQATYGVGSLVINLPDTEHSVFSEFGCVVLVIWERPVVILP